MQTGPPRTGACSTAPQEHQRRGARGKNKSPGQKISITERPACVVRHGLWPFPCCRGRGRQEGGAATVLRQPKLCQTRLARHCRIPLTIACAPGLCTGLVRTAQVSLPAQPRRVAPLLALKVLQVTQLRRRLLRLPHKQALVVVMHTDAQRDFDVALPNDIFVESFENGTRGGEDIF